MIKEILELHNDINNNLTVTLTKNIYSFSINFAQGGGDFVIKLIYIPKLCIRYLFFNPLIGFSHPYY